MKKLLQFKAAWCGPCKLLTPLIDQYKDKYDVQIIDVDENTELSIGYNIRNVPTAIILDGDTEIDRFIGGQVNKSNLDKYI